PTEHTPRRNLRHHFVLHCPVDDFGMAINTNPLPAQHAASALEVINNAAVPLVQGDVPINREKYGVIIQPNLFQVIAGSSSIRHATSEATPSIPRRQAATAPVLPHKRSANAISLQRGHIALGRLFAAHPRLTGWGTIQEHARMPGALNSCSRRQTSTKINCSSQTRHSLNNY